MNAALVIELFDSASHLTARQLFNDRFQLVVFLPHDLIESRGVDTSVLELLIRSAGIQRFVLPHVSAEQHAVLRSETAEERVHLCRAGQAGFIEHVEPFLIRVQLLLVARQMPLQRIRLDADLGQLVGGTGGRREALDLIALPFVANRRERRRLPGAGGAFERHDLIAIRQNLLDGRALALIQVLMLAGDRLAGTVGHQLRILPLAGTRLVDRLSFKFDHRWRRERSARHFWLLLHGDELASLDATIDLVLDVLNTRLYDLRSTYATRLSAGGVADEWATQLLRQGDAKVFKKSRR